MMFYETLAINVYRQINGNKFLNNGKSVSIDGMLVLKDGDFPDLPNAKISVKFKEDWINDMPKVYCNEKWVKSGDKEWHIYSDGELCYELPLKWQELLTETKRKVGLDLSLKLAENWLLHSSKKLLQKHIWAWRNCIAEWPDCWDYWGHGEIGIQEYRKLKNEK